MTIVISEISTMDIIKASEFKAKCLNLMDQVAATGEELIITKNGKPIAKLVPVAASSNLLGLHAGLMDISGDIESPIEVDWEAAG